MEWKDLYDRGHRPGLPELQAHWPEEVAACFRSFAHHLSRACNAGCPPPVYTQGAGWTFRFGRYSLFLLSGVRILPDGFTVEDLVVRDPASLEQAIAWADRRCADSYARELAAHAAEKTAKQGENAKRRIEREKKEAEALAARIHPERFNRYHWAAKVSRGDLRRLYEQDAAGIEDMELVEAVGFALWARCAQGREERELIETGRLRCHGCGAVLSYQADLMECACGRQYQFREYMRSFRRNNMPSGSAAQIFGAYLKDWPGARTYAEKMRLVDGLVHEFHINLMSGVKGRFVAVNLLEGTKKQIADLILSLAYGDERQQSKQEFLRHLKG